MTDSLCSLIASRVRFHRSELKMPRRTLARKTDISERYLAQLEAGKANISVLLIERIAQALDLPLTELVKPKGTPAIKKPLAHYLAGLNGKAQDAALKVLQEHFDDKPETGQNGIALIGIRGAGKSTLGQRLASEINLPFVKLSELIEADCGMSISELVGLGGQEGLRRCELAAMHKLTNRGDKIVLEASGGIVTSPQAYEVLLENFHTIHVRASAQEHIDRVVSQKDQRPMEGISEPLKEVEQMIRQRAPLFEKAHDIVDTTGQTVSMSEACLSALVPKFSLETANQ